jgi:CubicO group peptidase (beta-lactamase class C family)
MRIIKKKFTAGLKKQTLLIAFVLLLLNVFAGAKEFYMGVSSYADRSNKTIADKISSTDQINLSKESDDLKTKLDAQMKQLAEKGFSGVLFVAKDGKVVLNNGYGLADRENKTSYTLPKLFSTSVRLPNNLQARRF